MNAANDFEQDFFKLKINFVYGKTMKNLRKKINVRLVNKAEDFQHTLLIKFFVKIMLLFMK